MMSERSYNAARRSDGVNGDGAKPDQKDLCAAGVVAWIAKRLQRSQSHLNSGDADGDRASRFEHAVQDMGGDGNRTRR
jgi:hypothetical protein